MEERKRIICFVMLTYKIKLQESHPNLDKEFIRETSSFINFSSTKVGGNKLCQLACIDIEKQVVSLVSSPTY